MERSKEQSGFTAAQQKKEVVPKSLWCKLVFLTTAMPYYIGTQAALIRLVIEVHSLATLSNLDSTVRRLMQLEPRNRGVVLWMLSNLPISPLSF